MMSVKSRKPGLYWISLVLIFFSSVSPAAAESTVSTENPAITDARSAALTFLLYLDRRNFVRAEEMKYQKPANKTPVFLSIRRQREGWRLLGPLSRRTETRSLYHEKYTHLPEGKYVTFDYHLVFPDADRAGYEKLTMGRQDGEWRVLSYAYFGP